MSLPPIPLRIIRALAPSADRDEIVAGLEAEFAARASRDGVAAARRWVWRQMLASAPSLAHWRGWRDYTGFEPQSNAFRPRTPIVRTWIADISYALRRLRARPGYTTLAVLTLALGIGGIAAVFGIARPLIVDSLPYANAGQLGALWMPGWWTEEELLYLRGKFAGFSGVGAYRPSDATLREGNAPARLIPGVQVTGELFDVLGAKPLFGRNFRAGDDARGAQPVVMLSYGLWKELGGSPSIVGTTLALNGASRLVIGVMPARFWFPSPDIRLWHAQPLDPQGRNGSYALVGRAGAGFDIQHMSSPIAQLTRVIGERFQYAPKADKTRNATVTPLREALLGEIRPAVVATFVAMGLILLIACTNVAALMLGQVEGRTTEFAVRAALGATRLRITQQLIIEALIVGLLAGVAGSAIAVAGFGALARALPIGSWSDSVHFDWTLFGAALASAIVAVLIVVLAPVISLWRGDLRDALSGARTSGIQGRGGRLEQTLVVAEVALAMLIATGAGLLVRSVENRYAVDPGVDARGVAVVDVSAGPELSTAQRQQSLDEVVAALRGVPGVQSAAAGMKLPLRGGGNSFGITIEGRENEERSFTYFRVGTLDYFATLHYRLRAGRLFTSADRPDTNEIPVVINEALAARYFPGENPIGKRLGGGFSVAQRIVGVVANVAEADLTDRDPARYYLAGLVPWFDTRGAFVLRVASSHDPASVLDAARATVQRVAPTFAVQGVTTMQRVLDAAIGPARQVMALLTMLSALALILGAVGIYGVISYFASRRKRDWAIRVALGLRSAGVVRQVVRQGLVLAALGIVIGGAGAAALTRLLATFLFGVSPIDPVTFVAASGTLIVIGAAAAFIPAWRASTVDPALVLRGQ